MRGELSDYFERDHNRLDALLSEATRDEQHFNLEAFNEFRRGLLRHIGIEEKILLPAARDARGGSPLPIAERIRLDHGAIAALLVPPPSPKIIAALRGILSKHNLLEEEPGGMYEVCEQLAGDSLASVLDRVRHAPEVPVMPYNDAPFVLEATRRALARAGYNFDDY